MAAWAADPMGTVTTGPLRQAAPALGWPVLVAAAIGLAAVALYRLRPSRGTAIARVSLAAFALAGLVYATEAPPIVINGTDCSRTVVNSYDVTVNTLLENDCANQIEVVVINTPCLGDSVVAPDLQPSGGCAVTCTDGMILDPSAICMLPLCKT
ncbi:MAG TPA: hypothetical protein VMT89_11815 [Candidatus Acidoferrales bacterium]|nr:hypothetical protein [Candidatus Acidoferrales bacterium]